MYALTDKEEPFASFHQEIFASFQRDLCFISRYVLNFTKRSASFHQEVCFILTRGICFISNFSDCCGDRPALFAPESARPAFLTITLTCSACSSDRPALFASESARPAFFEGETETNRGCYSHLFCMDCNNLVTLFYHPSWSHNIAAIITIPCVQHLTECLYCRLLHWTC